MKNTPTPWKVFTEETCDGENVFPKLMTADFSEEIFPYGGGTDKEFANCDFIVTCVNCHADLLGALKHAVALLESPINIVLPMIESTIMERKAAIAKATGESA